MLCSLKIHIDLLEDLFSFLDLCARKALMFTRKSLLSVKTVNFSSCQVCKYKSHEFIFFKEKKGSHERGISVNIPV